MSSAVLIKPDADEEFALRQQRFMAPWEHDRGAKTQIYRGEEGYNADRDNADFRKRVRNHVHNKDVDGFTRAEKYGDDRADVGHIFASKNGGANEGRNIFMQESSWNASAQHKHDELHAAYNGYERTAAAHDACMQDGHGFKENKWGQMSPVDIVDEGKAKFKEVGVLCKKAGGVDLRCSAVKRGEIEVDKYGMVIGMKDKLAAIKNLDKTDAAINSTNESGQSIPGNREPSGPGSEKEATSAQWQLRDEVKQSLADGAQIGVRAARKENEKRLFLTTDETVQGSSNACKLIGRNSVESAAGLVAKEGLERLFDKSLPESFAVTRCVTEAAKGTLMTSGTLETRVQAGAQAGWDSLKATAQKSLIWERERIGVELPGNDMISIGTRRKEGCVLTKDGTEISGAQEELGVQFRKAIPESCGILGVGGNVGVTKTTTHTVRSTLLSTSERWRREELYGVHADLEFAGVPWLNLDTGRRRAEECCRNRSPVSGYTSNAETTSIMALGLETMVLSKKTSEHSDALMFTYSSREASYSWTGLGSEHVSIPFVQYERQGSSGLDANGRIILEDARISRVALSDTTRDSIKGSASYLYAKNSHNLGAGFKELKDGVLTIGKVACMDEAKEGFMRTLRGQGYPTQSIDFAWQYVAKPLWRVYQEKGEDGFVEQLETSVEDWCSSAQTQLREHPIEFVMSTINAIAPLMGSTLNLQWDDKCCGFTVAGNALGYGEQRCESASGYTCDKGLHLAYRIPCTLNLVGVSGCIGNSTAFRQELSEDGQRSLLRQTETDGAHAQLDVVGIRAADVQCGHIRSTEKYESTSTKETGGMSTSTQSYAFAGAGVCFAAGLANSLETSTTVGLGRNMTTNSTSSKEGGSSSFETSSCTIDGAIVKASGSVGKALAFGSIDLSTGLLTGVHVHGGSTHSGDFLLSAKQSWQATQCTKGLALVGLKLEVPTGFASQCECENCLCGLQFYKCSELQEGILNMSTTKTQTFFILVEVQEKEVGSLVSGRSKSVVISATPELQGMLGIASATAIGAYFAAVRKGLPVKEALSASCSTFCSAGKQAALDVGLSCISANIQQSLSFSSLHASSSWKALAPYVDGSIAALVRPVVNCILRDNYKLDDFGRDWVKQFSLMQITKLLQRVGVAGSAIQMLSAAYPRIFDQVASGNPDLLTLLVELVPVLLESGLKVTVSGSQYGWVLSYIVVPLLLELFRSPSVQALLGHILTEVKACASSLGAWLKEALEKLKRFFIEVGVAGVTLSITAGCAAGSAAASSASVMLAPAATVAGSQTLGSMAVSVGWMAAPVAPAGAVLGIASVAGVAVGVVTVFGYREAQKLLRAEFGEEGWRCKITVGSAVEVLVKTPRRYWVRGVVAIAQEKSIIVKIMSGDDERQGRYPRDSTLLRLCGQEGAIAAFVEGNGCDDDGSPDEKTN